MVLDLLGVWCSGLCEWISTNTNKRKPLEAQDLRECANCSTAAATAQAPWGFGKAFHQEVQTRSLSVGPILLPVTVDDDGQ